MRELGLARCARPKLGDWSTYTVLGFVGYAVASVIAAVLAFAYRKKWKTDEYPATAAMLAGVKEANDARLEREARAGQEAERARRDDARLEARDGRPAEGTKPVKVTRVISKNIVGEKTRLVMPAGGMSGVREGWAIRVRTGDGKMIELPVVKVLGRTSELEIDPELADSVQPLEIRPHAP